MAVQKSRKTRSRRGMRRSHDSLDNKTLSEDNVTGEMHVRHHMSAEGYYRGKAIIDLTDDADSDE